MSPYAKASRWREGLDDEQAQAVARAVGGLIGSLISYKIFRHLGASKWQAYAVASVLARLDRLRQR